MRNGRACAREAGLARMREFKKPVERTFTAAERDQVTILFGGLTWKHEEMIKAVFHGSGYRCENIPTPDGRRLPGRQRVRQQWPV